MKRRVALALIGLAVVIGTTLHAQPNTRRRAASSARGARSVKTTSRVSRSASRAPDGRP